MDLSARSHDSGFTVVLGKTILRIVVLLFVLHAAVFLAFDILPEAAYSQLGFAAVKKELLEETRQRMGLTGRLPERYWLSLTHCSRFDFGVSLRTGYPVAELLRRRALDSLPVVFTSLVVTISALLAGSWFYSTKRPSRWHHCVLALSPATLLPQFASASALATGAFFLLGLGTLSPSGLIGKSGRVTDALLITAVALMPAGILFTAAAKTALLMSRRRFVLTYEAIGLPWSRIRVLLQTNILQQMLPLANRALLALLLGTVFAELAFDRPGIGSVLTEAIRSGDQPVAAGWFLAVGGPVIFLSQALAAWNKRFPSAT